MQGLFATAACFAARLPVHFGHFLHAALLILCRCLLRTIVHAILLQCFFVLLLIIGIAAGSAAFSHCFVPSCISPLLHCAAVARFHFHPFCTASPVYIVH